jgi:hypothetical protein
MEQGAGAAAAAAGGVLTYEDLTASWKAADAVLKHNVASPVIVVRMYRTLLFTPLY